MVQVPPRGHTALGGRRTGRRTRHDSRPAAESSVADTAHRASHPAGKLHSLWRHRPWQPTSGTAPRRTDRAGLSARQRRTKRQECAAHALRPFRTSPNQQGLPRGVPPRLSGAPPGPDHVAQPCPLPPLAVGDAAESARRAPECSKLGVLGRLRSECPLFGVPSPPQGLTGAAVAKMWRPGHMSVTRLGLYPPRDTPRDQPHRRPVCRHSHPPVSSPR
jgi:hypothetical protein